MPSFQSSKSLAGMLVVIMEKKTCVHHMEFIIVGGLAVVGYIFSQQSPVVDSKYTDVPAPPNSVVAPPDAVPTTELDVYDRAQAEKRWKEALDPAKTGIVMSNTRMPQPFFSSAAKQHTNEKTKQTRLETFTGALDINSSQTGVYRKKQEIPNMFEPKTARVAITSSGTGGNLQYTPRMPHISGLQNNVRPTTQVMVGRGVGQGPETAAADGFHSMYRALPKNVNVYKKNNLQGVSNHGTSSVATRPMEVVMQKTRPTSFWTMERRPLAEGKFIVDAHARQPDEPRLTNKTCGGHYVGEEQYGNPAYAATAPRVADTVTDATRPVNNRNKSVAFPALNLAGEKAPHSKTQFEPSRMASQQREAQNPWNGMLKGPDGHMAPEGFDVQPTHRETSSKGYFGPLGTYVESGHVAPRDRPTTTLKDLANNSAFGGAAPILPAVERQGADKQLLRHAKRSEQLLGYMNGGTFIKPDAKLVGAIALRQGEIPSRVASHPTPPRQAQQKVGHMTSTYNKLPVQNARLDLSMAKQQLATNNLAVSIA